jgi:hypothetical protein
MAADLDIHPASSDEVLAAHRNVLETREAYFPRGMPFSSD